MTKRNYKLKFTGIILLLIFTTAIRAQSLGKITGKIVDSNNDPIELVSVGIQGTNKGVYTDENGFFSINVVQGNHILHISYVGSNTKKQVIVESGKTTDLGSVVLNTSLNVLDEVVVSGMITKFAQKKSDYVARLPISNLENPQVYTVVPKELLSEQVIVDFKNALTTSPGVSTVATSLGSGGVSMTMRMRGFSGSNGSWAIRNGMSTNFVSLSDPVNLESLEIIKGPSSTLFGSTLISYGGLVNRVTKKANEKRGGEVSFSTGSFGLGRLTADYNTPLNNEKTMLFRVNAAVHREKSFQDYGVNRTYMVAPTFTYHVNDRLTLNLDAEYFSSDRNSTFVGIQGPKISNFNEIDWDWKKSHASNDITSKSEVMNIFAEAKYKLSDQWTSQTLASYSYTDNDANYLFLLAV